MNHPLFMSQLAVADSVTRTIERNPVLRSGSWRENREDNRFFETSMDRYEAFWNWEKFHRITGKSMKDYEDQVQKDISLRKHLMEQLEASGLGSGSYRVCRYMIGKMDDAGYLDYSREEAANLCFANPWDVELAEGMVRAMDPPGVGTANTEAALRTQRRGGFPEIPRPGIRYRDHEAKRFVVPDIVIRRSRTYAKGYLNVTGLPMPVIDNRCRELIPEISDMRKIEYLSQSFETGRQLIYDLKVRHQFLHKVMETIVEANQDFFLGRTTRPEEKTLLRLNRETGIPMKYLPLIVRNKYIHCGDDFYSLEYFVATPVIARG